MRPCKSRHDLENLKNIAYDRQQTNPATIAKALMDMDCPFSCTYIEHSVVSVLKRHDVKIGPDKVRLTFKLVTNVEEGQGIMVSDVDISLDMFVSDIGTAFGTLLGKLLV